MSARGYFGALAKARKFWAAENARYAASADTHPEGRRRETGSVFDGERGQRS